MGQVRQIYKSYNLNSTQFIVKKKKFMTQSNSLTFENQPNLMSWIGSNRFEQVGSSPHSRNLEIDLYIWV